jgi:MoaA/NifB/PqqE/SkfB family radical SAM enzyme
MGYSVGIGLTNACDLQCAHCYRDTTRTDMISLEQVRRICEALPVDAMGLGTGESGLHPEFPAIVRYLHGRGVKLSVASNGYTLMGMPDDLLRAFHDVEVSIDFPTAAEQDAFRGPGNWELVHAAMARCREHRVPASILVTLMATNYDRMAELVALARRNGANLRVNAYQPVHTDRYRLSYEQFWSGYAGLFAAGLVVSCSEPVVRAAMGLDEVRSPCARNSIRFNPRGQLIPCVYWPLDGARAPRIEDLIALGEQALDAPAFVAARATPPSAAGCRCQGGCASRRALLGDLDAHDAYCPWVRGDEIHLAWRPAPARDLMRSGNVCTTVVL